ncbi:MAG: hypothetical protein WAV89_15190 [Ignavibacteriaceae bacterium]
MKILYKIIFTITFITFFNTCNTTEPIDDTKPGRRDYVWTVDTLPGLNNPRFRMWGSSQTDIWATTMSNWENSISHFNGTSWTSFGISDLTNAHAIFGFSNSEVFIGTADRGRIWKFDGVNWSIFVELNKDGHNDIAFNDIWGVSENDFFSVGAYPDQYGFNNSVIAHYLNGNWTMLNTKGLYGIITHLYKDSRDNNIYLQVNGGTDFTDSTKIYKLTLGKYQLLYGNIWTKGFQADLSFINNEVIFVLGNRIARRVNDQFYTIVNVDNSNFYQRIWGRNSKDIFLLMTDGLAHYNGTDVEYLFYFTLANEKPWTQIYGAAIFEKELFFLIYEPPTGLSLVYHGILK